MVLTSGLGKRKGGINVKQEQQEGSFTTPCHQSSEAVIPAKKHQHEKEASNQADMLQQSSFVHTQKSVIPDPEGFGKFHSSGQLDLVADETTSRVGNDLSSNNLNSILQGEISSNCLLGNGPQKSDSFNLTEIAEKMGNYGLNEVDSFGSETTLVSVKGYKVKPKYESLFGYILSKYGDIGVNCCLGTVKFRSLYMDAVCEIIHKLMDTNIVAITDDDLEEMMGYVRDVEKANIDIGWLKERLNEIHEAKQAIQVLGLSSNEKNHHAELKAQVKKRSQELEGYKRELAIKEAQLQDLENEILATERDIVEMEDGVAQVEKVISENKAKLRPFVKFGSLTQGLFG